MEQITWQQLKDFCNTLSPEQLEKRVWFFEIEQDGKPVHEAATYEEDMYVNINDSDDCGTLEDLKSIHEDAFKIEDYKIGAPKGMPFLWGE